MTQLHIHIGTHKTGTTAIQTALDDSRRALATEGIGVFRSQYDADISRATEIQPSLTDAARDELKSSMDRAPKLQSWIWSFEGFSGDLRTGYANTKVVANSLRQIVGDIPTSIIVYLRRQDRFAESAYTQSIHEGGSWTFAEFLDSTRYAAFDWSRLVELYESEFGWDALEVRTYNKKRLNDVGGLLSEFADIIGAGHLQASGRKSNRGYSREALEVARACNAHLSKLEKRALRKLLQESNARGASEQYAFFGDDDRVDFLERYSTCNARLKSRFFPQVDGELFERADEPRNNARHDFEFDAESAARVLGRALAHQKLSEPRSLDILRNLERHLLGWLSSTPDLKRWLRSILT